MTAYRSWGVLQRFKGILPGALIITFLGSVGLAGEWDFVMDPENPMLTAVPHTWQHVFTQVHVVKVEEEYFLYYAAEQTNYIGRIGLAVSSDGSHFQPRESWVLDKGTLNFEKWIAQAPRALWSPETGMRLWYWGFSGCCPYGQGMGEADSADGIAFARHESNRQWDPFALADYMFTSASVIFDPDDASRPYRQYVTLHSEGKLRIGIITSIDGVAWEWYGFVVQPGPSGAWNEVGVRNPVVLKYGDGYFMVYRCQNKLGIAVSDDGLTWIERPDNPCFTKNDGFNAPGGIVEGNVLHLWYVNGWKGTEIRHMWSEIPEDLYDFDCPTPAPSFAPVYAPIVAETPFTPTPSPTPHPGGWDFALDPANPVVVAEAGTWQDHFVQLHAVEVNDNYYLYYSGEEISTEGRIGLATSENGSLFHRGDTWVLDNGPSGAFDSWIVSVPRAAWNPAEGMRLWYLGYTGCCPYGQAIGEADSADGIDFSRLPTNPQWDHSGVGDYMFGGACVLLDPDEPNALLRYKQYSGIYDHGVTQIGLIASPDGVNWTWYGYVLEAGPPGEWDEGQVANPTVLKYGEGYLMLYRSLAGNDRLGIALSLDGVNWAKYPYNPLPPSERTVRETTALIEDNVLHLWYLTAFKGTEVHHAWSVIPEGLFDVEFPTPPPPATPTLTPTPTVTPTPTPMPFAVILSAWIEPEEAYTLDDLECVTEVDNVGGYPELFYSYRWFRDGEELTDPLKIGSEIFPVTESVLSHHFTAKNQAFSCIARVTDGTGSVETTTDPVTILNSPPTAPEIAILPENPTPDDGLAVWFVEYSIDPDGDLVLPVFEWFESSDGENWTRRTELSGSIDPYDRGEPEVSSLYTQMAEYWQVAVTPVEFEAVGKPVEVMSAAELAALEVVEAGESASDDVYILPDLNGDDRVDGEDLLVLRSVWHKQKSEMDTALSPLFFESGASATRVVGVEDLFKFAVRGWQMGSGE